MLTKLVDRLEVAGENLIELVWWEGARWGWLEESLPKATPRRCLKAMPNRTNARKRRTWILPRHQTSPSHLAIAQQDVSFVQNWY